jgi:hypothetical protein
MSTVSAMRGCYEIKSTGQLRRLLCSVRVPRLRLLLYLTAHNNRRSWPALLISQQSSRAVV